MSISIAFGIHPVKEAIKNNKKLHKVIIQKGLNSESISDIIHQCKENDIPFQFVPRERLQYLTKENHQGVIAQLSAIEFRDIEELAPFLLEIKDNPIIAILDGVTDVRNIGAIARSAECFGIDALFIPTFGSAIINEEAIKSSAGALFTVPVARGINFFKGIDFLIACGFQLIALSEKGTDTLESIDFRLPTAIILGDEGEGIDYQVLKKSNHKVSLPMIGEISSLNVSVAAGITFYLIQNKKSIS